MTVSDPLADDRIDLLIRQARAGWNTLLRLSMIKDRLVVHGKPVEELDLEIVGADSLIAECEAQLAALGYRPKWMDNDPIVREEKKKRKRKPKRPPHEAWRDLPGLF